MSIRISYKSDVKTRKILVISARIKIDVESIRLWKVLTAPGHLKNFHPFCVHIMKKVNGMG